MTATDVYAEVCDLLLEDGGLQFTYTEAAFLRDLYASIAELSSETSFAIDIIGPISMTTGDATYNLPATALRPLAVMVNGRALAKSSASDQEFSSGRSSEMDEDIPEEWVFDGAVGVRIAPAPSYDGTLSVVATVGQSASSYALGATLELVPDSIASYLKWMVLEKIWNNDGEAKDVARAKYCTARRQELINLINAITLEDIQTKAA